MLLGSSICLCTVTTTPVTPPFFGLLSSSCLCKVTTTTSTVTSICLCKWQLLRWQTTLARVVRWQPRRNTCPRISPLFDSSGVLVSVCCTARSARVLVVPTRGWLTSEHRCFPITMIRIRDLERKKRVTSTPFPIIGCAATVFKWISFVSLCCTVATLVS